MSEKGHSKMVAMVTASENICRLNPPIPPLPPPPLPPPPPPPLHLDCFGSTFGVLWMLMDFTITTTTFSPFQWCLFCCCWYYFPWSIVSGAEEIFFRFSSILNCVVCALCIPWSRHYCIIVRFACWRQLHLRNTIRTDIKTRHKRKMNEEYTKREQTK